MSFFVSQEPEDYMQAFSTTLSIHRLYPKSWLLLMRLEIIENLIKDFLNCVQQLTNYHRQIRCDESHSTFHVLVNFQFEIVHIDGHVTSFVDLRLFGVSEWSSRQENDVRDIEENHNDDTKLYP